MKIVYSKFIPFKGFLAINLFGVLFVRKEYKDVFERTKKQVITHESIHTQQMQEMGYIFFYIWYFIEWLIRLCINYKTAYKSISFEREAYLFQNSPSYLTDRIHYAWLWYL